VKQLRRFGIVLTILWWFGFETLRDWKQWRERKAK
jgi:hypothetical protein